MANDAQGQEKQRDYITQKANILSLQGPTASFAIEQGIFFVPYDHILKGPIDPAF